MFLTYRLQFVSDDGYISFRYAKHLVEGFGLTYNPGIRVEGYTNFLWVMLIAAGMKLGVSPELFSSTLGVLSGLILVILIFDFGKKTYGNILPVLIAPLCLSLNRSYAEWMTGGLETRFFTLLVFAANIFLLKELRLLNKNSTRSTGFLCGLLFGLAALTRPEGYFFMGLGYAFVLVVRKIKPSIRDLYPLIGFLACVIPHLVWKYFYYGDLLPNTFYAKVSGLWLNQGVYYVAVFFVYYSLWLLFPIAIGNFAFLIPNFKKIQLQDKRFIVGGYFFFITCMYLLYLIIIGGDRFEFRQTDPILPYLYLSIQGGFIGVFRRLKNQKFNTLKLSRIAVLFFVLMLLTPILTAVPLKKRFSYIKGIASVRGIKSFARRRAWEGKLMASIVKPGETIAVRGAGALPYFNSDNFVLDMLGLSDREIARQKLTKRGVIGHEKHASKEYICSHTITFIEWRNRFFYERPPTPREMESITRTGGIFCLKIKNDLYLICATTLNNRQLSERFKDFEILFLTSKPWCDTAYW